MSGGAGKRERVGESGGKEGAEERVGVRVMERGSCEGELVGFESE